MSDQTAPNGTSTPTSRLSSLALTEYSAIPTPTSEKEEYRGPESPPSWDIPDAFLLPNGYPDVRFYFVYGPSFNPSNMSLITSISD
jgi:threonine dehydratase